MEVSLPGPLTAHRPRDHPWVPDFFASSKHQPLRASEAFSSKAACLRSCGKSVDHHTARPLPPPASPEGRRHSRVHTELTVIAIYVMLPITHDCLIVS